ncbi:MAG: hypothetical protein HQ472_11205 [Ignavibacteria bacterium]|nr:hypothetical protein [Ignavibacteria bacterium]
MNKKRKKSSTDTPWAAVTAKIIGGVLMVVIYFITGNPWYLAAAALFALAGFGLVYFMRHLRKKFGQTS